MGKRDSDFRVPEEVKTGYGATRKGLAGKGKRGCGTMEEEGDEDEGDDEDDLDRCLATEKQRQGSWVP